MYKILRFSWIPVLIILWLTFWHRNLTFKFLHPLYVKCE
jgi:hypothetical protein